MEGKYRSVKSKYLANALSYLGFKYYTYENGYSFKDTIELDYAINKILKLKKELNLNKY